MNRPRLLLGAALLLATLHPSSATVRVTGRLLEINHAREIPRGLFGVHASKLTPEIIREHGIESVRLIHQKPRPSPTRPGRDKQAPKGLSVVVDCWFDRYQPALQISDPAGWRERLDKLARDYAAAARTGGHAFLEFWNEPYLNWATKPGVNYAPTHYVTERAAPGAPMILRATGRPVEGLEWDREIFYVLDRNGAINPVLSGYIPRDALPGVETQLGYGAGRAVLEDGGTVRLRGAEHRLARLWSGRDPGQQFYWSGPVNVRLYNEMLAVLGPAVKETNPEVQLAAGWGFNFFNENWESWRRLIQPTIDAAHPWIDALHEHHYGGDTRRVAASYEVAHAYTLGKYGKRLGFWNTEAGGYLDPQQPGNPQVNAPQTPAARALNSATYLLRDIACLLDKMPDKALHRAAHEPEANGGDLPALRLLKPLRGLLMESETSTPGIFAAAALEGRALSVLLFNDSRSSVEESITVEVPAGTAFETLIERRLERHEEAPFLRLKETPDAARGTSWQGSATLAPQEAVVLVFTLDSEAQAPPVVRREQYVSPDVLLSLSGGPVETRIPVPAFHAGDSQPDGAILRLVVEGVPGDVSIELNGQKIEAPRPLHSPIWDIRVPSRILEPDNTLRVAATPAQGRLLASSIYLERVEAGP